MRNMLCTAGCPGSLVVHTKEYWPFCGACVPPSAPHALRHNMRHSCSAVLSQHELGGVLCRKCGNHGTRHWYSAAQLPESEYCGKIFRCAVLLLIDCELVSLASWLLGKVLTVCITSSGMLQMLRHVVLTFGQESTRQCVCWYIFRAVRKLQDSCYTS